MVDIVFVFEVHQPYRIRKEIHNRILERALEKELDLSDLEDIIFDTELNKYVFQRVSRKCYIPATKIILELIDKYKNTNKPFKVSFSLSGLFIEQALRWEPEVIDLFRKLVDTGYIELVGQTFYHSLASLMPLPGYLELREQIEEHRRVLREVFGYDPVTVENTEFIYNNDIACFLEKLGFKTILTEGVDWVLGWRSPNYVYRAYGCSIRVLTRDYRLSDDIGFRFSDRNWDQYPLTADKYASWLAGKSGDVVVLAMDYETFGEHHPVESGILEFLKWLPHEVSRYPHLEFSIPREVVEKHPVRGVYDVPSWATISWADERDVSAWLGNSMQNSAFRILNDIRPYVVATGDKSLIRLWKLLSTSDHFYYMATKHGSLEEVHSHFSPYDNPIEAHTVYLKAIHTLIAFITRELVGKTHVLARIPLPSNRAFYFYRSDGSYTGFVAHSLIEFYELLDKVPHDSITYHVLRGDIQLWISTTYGLRDIASEISRLVENGVRGEELRRELKNLLRRAIETK
ncbi:MAG: alpha-amylase [Thermoprotei archaeon]